MLVLIIKGIDPKSKNQSEFKSLIEDLKSSVMSVEGLDVVYEHHISVYLTPDLYQERSGEGIICFVEGLFDRPERTKEIRDRLAEKIRNALWRHFRDVLVIDVFIKRFHNDDGFASTRGGGCRKHPG